MDASLISAGSGLLGAAVGGLTAFATNWTTQQAQLRSKLLDRGLQRREELFNQFIVDAARLFGDALTHQPDDLVNVVQLYSIVARLRLLGSRAVILAAEAAMEAIIKTYLEPNRTFRDLAGSKKEDMDFLLAFGEACRTELAEYSVRG